MTSRCIITGCWLLDAATQQVVRGDLHEDGNVYIFNAVLTPAGMRPAWCDISNIHPDDKVIEVSPAWPYFERRAVFVIRRDQALLNVNALDYLK